MSNHIPNFKFWVQKTLPAVYDDSLSYYELLCKVVASLNEVINSQNGLLDGFEELTNNFNILKNYVDNYFINLNVQNEINKKLDAMASDGTLDKIMGYRLDDIYNQISVLNNRINNITSGSPAGSYSTLVNLQADTTANKNRIYVITSTGEWAYWNGSTWVIGGIYQNKEIGKDSVNRYHMDFNTKSLLYIDSVNMLNYKEIYLEKTYYNFSTGAITPNPDNNVWRIDVIDIPYVNITLSLVRFGYAAWFDASMNKISELAGISPEAQTRADKPNGARFFVWNEPIIAPVTKSLMSQNNNALYSLTSIHNDMYHFMAKFNPNREATNLSSHFWKKGWWTLGATWQNNDGINAYLFDMTENAGIEFYNNGGLITNGALLDINYTVLEIIPTTQKAEKVSFYVPASCKYVGLIDSVTNPSLNVKLIKPSKNPVNGYIPITANKTINIMGDSFTATNSFQNPLQERCQFSIINNYGWAGITIGGLNDKINEVNTPCDYFIIQGGTNDFSANIPIGNISDNNTTFYGSVKNIIDKIINKFPKSDILVICPPYRADKALNDIGLSLKDYVNVMIEVCNMKNVRFINMFNESGINDKNYETFLADKIHLNGNGGQRYGYRIAGKLNS